MGLLKIGKRKINLERSQPAHRKRFGLLEKHKDYVKRARDYHRKQDELTRLRRLASMRNPDEFYTSMINSKSVNGIHRSSSSSGPHSFTTLKIYNTQDLAHLQLLRSQDKAAIERLEADLHLRFKEENSNSKRTHKKFFDDESQREVYLNSKEISTAQKFEDHFGDLAQVLDSDTLETKGIELSRLEKIASAQEKRFRDLLAHVDRLKKVELLISQVELRRNLMGKGARVKIFEHKDVFGEVDKSRPAVYKWKSERKR